VARQKRLLIFAVTSTALLMATSLSIRGTSSSAKSPASPAKSAEKYWAESGLQPEALEVLLQPESCRRSEREFLACANAVLIVAQKYGVAVNFAGEIHEGLDSASRQIFAEKELLEPWEKWISGQATLPEFSFLKAWKTLFEKYVPADMREYAIGLGINAYLSVAQDPHTYILPGEYYSEVVAKASHRSVSIGLVIGRNDNDYFVKKILDQSTADTAGLKKGDIVVGLNGLPARSLSPFEVTNQLKGEAGSALKLKLRREGKLLEIVLVRQERNMQTVSSHVLEGIKPFGILTINKFAFGTCDGVKAALEALMPQGIMGLLLDLRDNPGGQMSEAACVSSLFLGPGKKVFEIKLLGETTADEVVYTNEDQVFSKPMAVLVNSGSASAAEILAGALQAHGRAVLVGERTFGKGSFQEGMVWSKNKKIALFQTKGFYFLPSGLTPQLVGLEPDVKLNFKDKFALRESEQYLYPLHAMGIAPNVVSTQRTPPLLPGNILSCVSFESELLAPEDPEIQEAHRILNCRGIAGRGEQ
jgi:carboxyl-terminal processing protease